jgi:hypothetical protein
MKSLNLSNKMWFLVLYISGVITYGIIGLFIHLLVATMI